MCAFRSSDLDDATEFEIYNSKDDTWKVSGEITFAARKLIPKSGVCVNDVAYWQTVNGSILLFDLVKDRSQVLHGCSSTNGALGEMNGKLCSAFINGNTLTVSFISNIYSDTMQMGSNARLWGDQVRIGLSNDVVNGVSYDVTPVLYAGGGAVLVLSGRKIYRCDLKTLKCKFVVEASCFGGKAIPYVNSLVAL